jgi:polysaccharide export outer membrane protein
MRKLILLLVLCLGFGGAAAPAQQSKNPGYRIGPKDQLKIQVFEVPELNVDRRVSENGSINLPLIGDVPAAGLTEEELAIRLKVLLEVKYVQRASTAVEVTEFRSKPISVIGAVKTPGNLAFSGRWTLIEALTAAGGLAENHGNRIYVLRKAENGLSDQVAIDVADLLVRADPRVNIPILASDLINVPTAVEVTIYCLGEVAHPGALAFKSTDRITLLAAIARAGGLTDRAANRLTIKRTAGGGAHEIFVDYKRILSGKDQDVALVEGDVLVAKESFF